MKSYKNEIDEWKNTLYGQELEFTENMIYSQKWVLPNKPISDEFFWEQFYKNERAIALIYIMHENNMKSWRDVNKISDSVIGQNVARQIENMKKSPRVTTGASEQSQKTGLLIGARMKIGDLPMSKSLRGYAVFLVLLAVVIGLLVYFPIVGIVGLILFLLLLSTMWPRGSKRFQN